MSGDLRGISSGIDGPGRRFAKPHFKVWLWPDHADASDSFEGPRGPIMIPGPKPAAARARAGKRRPTAPGPSSYIARGGSGRLGRPQGRTYTAALAGRVDSVHGPGSPVDSSRLETLKFELWLI
jgi:hypothetical protein